MVVGLPIFFGFPGSSCCTLASQDGLIGAISEVGRMATDKERLEFVDVVLDVIVFFGILCFVSVWLMLKNLLGFFLSSGVSKGVFEVAAVKMAVPFLATSEVLLKFDGCWLVAVV